jgi:hypothetical protein
MGVSLALVAIDHEAIVERGLAVLNDAIAAGDPEKLRAYMRGLAVDVDPAIVAVHEKRLATLKSMNAPRVILENEKRLLTQAKDPRAGLDEARLPELRGRLGAWCFRSRDCDIDKLWDVVHWFCDPKRRKHKLDEPRFPDDKKAKPTTFDLAIHGEAPGPTDADGEPFFGDAMDPVRYNPPATTQKIAKALAAVDKSGWPALAKKLDDDACYLGGLQDALGAATEARERLARFYARFAERGFGVSVSFY